MTGTGRSVEDVELATLAEVDSMHTVAYLHPGTTAWLGLVREASLSPSTWPWC